MKMRKIIAVIAAALMLFSILPVAAFAADAETVKYTISSYSAGTQYKAETHELDEYLTVITNTRCHFTTELRIYAPSGSVNGEVILASTREMTAVVLNAGNKASTLTVSTSPDNSTWTQHSTLSVASSYKDLSISNLPAGTKYIKLVNGSGQVRVKYITVSYAADVTPDPDVPSTCEHDWELISTTAATCTTAGEEYYECAACGESKTEAVNALGHDWEIISEEEATCTAEGSTTYECAACGEDKVETIPALPHNYVDGFCSACGEAKPLNATIDFSTKDQRTEYSTTVQKWENDGLTLINNKASSTSNVGDYAAPARFYKSSTITISYEGMTSLVIDASGISSNGDWKATLSAYSYTVDNNVYTIAFATPTDEITLTAAAQVRANSITAYGAAPSDCEHDYVGVETQAPTCSAEGVMTYTCSKCQESYTEAIAVIPHSYVEDVIDSTCTTTGTKTYECSVCGHSYNEVIPVKAHNYVDDVCADCGHVKAYKGTLIFDADKENRTEYSAQIQVWESEGVKLTNNKGASTTNVGDYSNPGRFYKDSEIIIEFPEMGQLIINAENVDGVKYSDPWVDTLASYNAVKSGDGTYTITFDEPVNSITVTATAQVRANSITAIVAHECVWADATCTAPKTCTKCGATEGEALGHTYFDDCSAICEVCGYEREAGHTIAHVEAAAPTCTAMGNIEYWCCEACGMAWLDEACTLNTNLRAVVLPMADHTYDNEYDVDCNACGAIRTVTVTIVGGEFSASEDVRGLAAKFDVDDVVIGIAQGYITLADYTNATLNGNKLIMMGAKADNGVSNTNINAVRLCNWSDDYEDVAFAVRVINIPEGKEDVQITFTPYFTVEIDGVRTTYHGTAVAKSYNGAITGIAD